MKKLLFVANHPAPQELASDYDVTALPEELKTLWANIPKSGLKNHLAGILELARDYDVVVVTGEPRACHIVATELEGKCFSTFSKRESVDSIQPDGSVVKTSRFVFEGLVAYE